MLLRPSIKFVKLSYIACFLLAAAIYIASQEYPDYKNYLLIALVIPAIWLIATMVKHVERRTVQLEISGDRLRYQSGLLSKATRTVELVKVQDVRVDQSLGQRMANIGDLSLETAGQGSRIGINSIDNPHEAAEHILSLAQAQRAKPPEPHGV